MVVDHTHWGGVPYIENCGSLNISLISNRGWYTMSLERQYLTR